MGMGVVGRVNSRKMESVPSFMLCIKNQAFESKNGFNAPMFLTPRIHCNPGK